jgi:probable F420-dependent oxidoreductase
MSSNDTPVRRGVVFPQGSMTNSPDQVREYILGLEKIGYDHLVIPDHVLGVDPSSHPGWSGPYDVVDRFHELFVLCGFLAAFTTIELVPGVLVLPQRQTALAAKQAAEIELLSSGRFRLGVGVGWNSPEFEGLGASFVDRGARLDEQIRLMRELWREAVVDFDGDFHSLHGVGIAPLPAREIPIWIGAERAPRALKQHVRSTSSESPRKKRAAIHTPSDSRPGSRWMPSTRIAQSEKPPDGEASVRPTSRSTRVAPAHGRSASISTWPTARSGCSSGPAHVSLAARADKADRRGAANLSGYSQYVADPPLESCHDHQC